MEMRIRKENKESPVYFHPRAKAGEKLPSHDFEWEGERSG